MAHRNSIMDVRLLDGCCGNSKKRPIQCSVGLPVSFIVLLCLLSSIALASIALPCGWATGVLTVARKWAKIRKRGDNLRSRGDDGPSSTTLGHGNGDGNLMASRLTRLATSHISIAVGENHHKAALTSKQRLHRRPPRVNVQCGTVDGAWEDDEVAAFRGIPYGEPPVGERRWKPAAPAACWALGAVFNASRDGNICYQNGGGGDRQSEDCLNLNVFVQGSHLIRKNESRLPVLVWIYGGANWAGSVASYGPLENIVRKRSHILVMMNYRLGIFGYLALRELSAVDPRKTSGNLGITDQQLALDWVRENIAHFGGDPNSVTIFGQSSGGTNVLAHLASPGSKGLFHRAIALSGSPNITMDKSSKEEQDRRLILPRTPCAGTSGPSLLRCLYAVSASDLDGALPSSYELFDKLYDYPTQRIGLKARVSALLHVDGVTVALPLEKALAQGLNDVPVLLQSAQAEMDCYPEQSLAELTKDELRMFFQNRFAAPYGQAAAAKIYDFYQHYSPPSYGVYAVDADTGAACGLRRLALAAGQGFQSPVYWGTVTALPGSPAPEEPHFPYHNWDVEAATDTASFYGHNLSETDRRFGERLLRDWSDLASNGRLDRMSGWRRVQESGGDHVWGSQVGANETIPVPDHKAEVCSFWESIRVDQRWWWIN